MNLPPSSWLEKPSSPSWSRRVPCRDQQQYRSPSCKPCCVKPSSLRVVRALARRSFSHSLLAPLKHFPARVRPRNRFLSGRECYSGLAGYTNLCWGGGGCGACTPKIRTLHSFSARARHPPQTHCEFTKRRMDRGRPKTNLLLWHHCKVDPPRQPGQALLGEKAIDRVVSGAVPRWLLGAAV